MPKVLSLLRGLYRDAEPPCYFVGLDLKEDLGNPVSKTVKIESPVYLRSGGNPLQFTVDGFQMQVATHFTALHILEIWEKLGNWV